MSLLEKLKSMFDTRTEVEKAYEMDPLRRRTQYMKVYIKDISAPFIKIYSQADKKYNDLVFRNANLDSFNSDLNCWLAKRGSDGIRIDDVWYGPESIVRIELGQQTVEDL